MCFIFELSTENIKKWDKTVMKMWSQNIKKDAYFFHGFRISNKMQTFFFMGSEVCLERCDSYGDFGYLEKN